MLQHPSSTKKSAIKKKLTPKKLPVQTATQLALLQILEAKRNFS
jgi:hypothetical protein